MYNVSFVLIRMPCHGYWVSDLKSDERFFVYYFIDYDLMYTPDRSGNGLINVNSWCVSMEKMFCILYSPVMAIDRSLRGCTHAFEFHDMIALDSQRYNAHR
jgi:hypothetical protein